MNTAPYLKILADNMLIHIGNGHVRVHILIVIHFYIQQSIFQLQVLICNT